MNKFTSNYVAMVVGDIKSPLKDQYLAVLTDYANACGWQRDNRRHQALLERHHLQTFRPTTLGDAIVHYQQAAQMSSTELADKVGVSRSYLSSVRKGKNSPSPELVDKIAEALSIPSIFLYERSTSHPLHTYERQVALASFETFVKRTLYKPPTK